MGEIFPSGLKVQDLQEFHPRDLTMQLILDLFGAVLLNTDMNQPKHSPSRTEIQSIFPPQVYIYSHVTVFLFFFFSL